MPHVLIEEGVRVSKLCRPVVRGGNTLGIGSRVRIAVGVLAWVMSGSLLVSCASRLPAPEPTAVNPENFPQALAPQEPPIPQELPPPATENRTFVTIDGIPQYRIGAGDVLEVLLTRGPTQDRLQVLVRTNGRILVSFAEIYVDGLTADQAAEEIAQKLSAYFRNPQVDVQVKEYNSKKVSVLGGVGLAPRGGVGTVPLTGRTTLLEVIARSGGLAPNAGLDRVRVTRLGGKSYTVNMYRYVQEGDLSQEFIMDAGDVVFVPERVAGEERQVFLLGEVRKPGPVPLYPSMTLSQLIGQVGGWTDSARFEEARVIRGDLNKPEIISIDLARLVLQGDRRIEQLLRPNDVVFIPRTPIADWNAFLAQLRPTLDFIVQGMQPVILFETIRRD
jgi:polysaccharide export outer membrane protein